MRDLDTISCLQGSRGGQKGGARTVQSVNLLNFHFAPGEHKLNSLSGKLLSRMKD